MKPKSPIAAAILLKLKKGEQPEPEDGEDFDPEAEAKAGAMKALFKAYKTSDVPAGVEALESFVRACSYEDEPTDEDTDTE
jgi:hypothetical protein